MVQKNKSKLKESPESRLSKTVRDEVLAGLVPYFDRIEARFAKQDATFARQDDRFARQDATFTRQDDRFAKQDATFTRQDERFTKQDATFTRQDERFTKQDAIFARQDERFDKIDIRFDEMGQQLSNLQLSFIQLETSLRKDFKAVEEQGQRNSADIIKLKEEVLGALDGIASLLPEKVVIGNHETRIQNLEQNVTVIKSTIKNLTRV